MNRDPSPRADGKCAVCRKKRPDPGRKGEHARRPGWREEWAADPFCSSTCCRKFHGCAIVEDGRSRSSGIDNRRGRVLSTRAERAGRALEKTRRLNEDVPKSQAGTT